jgi:poly(3-hydroxybutyrate) depolymerase
MVKKTVLAPIAAVALVVLATVGTALGGGSGAAADDVTTLAATAGCGRTPTLTSGTRSIQSSGQNRTYILRIPANYNNQNPYRLILGFHWLNGSANDVDTGQTVPGGNWAYYGLQRLANNSTIFIAPQGLNNGWSNPNGQDITLVDDILRQVEADLCVDTSQRFALGWSFGGAMSFALACARPTVFRAVAVYSGAQLSGCSGGTQPVAYLGAHGLTDNVLAISNGRTLRDRFVRNNGCTAQNPPEPPQGSLSHRSTSYSGCAAGFPVRWIAFDDGHNPAPADGQTGLNGNTYLPAETWTFFTQFQSTPTTPPVTTTTTTTSRPPSTTTTSRPPSTTTATNPTGGCTATYRTIGNPWPGGFQGEFAVTNNGSTTTNGWTVRFTLGSGQSLAQLWGGRPSTSGSTVSVANEAWNGRLAPAAGTTFGFIANGSFAAPTGVTCTAT